MYIETPNDIEIDGVERKIEIIAHSYDKWFDIFFF